MSRRTILHLIDTGGPGGAETVFMNLVTRLTRVGWDSIAVVPVKDWLWSELRAHGVDPIFLPSAGAFDLAYLRGLVQLARQHDAGLIQTHLFTTAVYGSLAGRMGRLPVVCTHHGFTDIATSGSYRNIKFRIVRRKQNQHVFVSNDLKRRFAADRIVSGSHARVIHNGIDCELFRPARDLALRAELGIGADDVLVGAVGNLRGPKDYPNFLRAAAQLSAMSPRYRFIIAGAADEPIRGELLQLAGDLGIADRFALIGFRQDVERVMNALDVYVLSSNSEGFSLTTVQAMACGVPVVATRCGGPEEIVTDGKTGTLVPVGEPSALARAVHTISSSERGRLELVKAGRARAIANFSIAAMISGYSTLYQECLAPAVALPSA